MRSKILNFSIFIFVLSFLILPSVVSAVEYIPLVPCGLKVQPVDSAGNRIGDPAIDYTQPCTRCHAFKLAENVIDFGLEGIVPPVAAVLFIAAGLMILLAGANQKLYATGIAIFKNAFIGLVIILASWMIVNTFIQSFGPDQVKGSWFKFTCEAGAITPGGPTVPGPITTQQAAQELISAIGLGSFSTNAGCGGNFHARQNIQDMAAGRLPAVCSPSCSCVTGGPSGNITVDPSILNGLRALWNRGIRFSVTSFTTGRHSSGSRHYQGRAVDVAVSGNQTIWIEARGFLNTLGGTARCEETGGGVVLDCNLSRTSHIHWQK